MRALNPFTDVTLGAAFRRGDRVRDVSGFYDGEGVYRVRFMPGETGSWSWETRSNRAELREAWGRFTCAKAGSGNHGPVRVAKRYHFSHEDGTPFFPMGTTAYAWTYRPEEVRRRTLESFSRYGFNKIRMLFFPKHYGDGKNVDVSYDPPVLPFEGGPGAWDRRRFVPAYFRSFEDRVGDLCDRSIEADVILYHFYDSGKWGLDEGWSREDDRRYLDYLVARLAPYRNVWWSLANEYDLVVDPRKGTVVSVPDRKDWDGIGGSPREDRPLGSPEVRAPVAVRTPLPESALADPRVLPAPEHLLAPDGAPSTLRQARDQRRVPVRGQPPHGLGQLQRRRGDGPALGRGDGGGLRHAWRGVQHAHEQARHLLVVRRHVAGGAARHA